MKFSVIIPVYNVSTYLRRCVRSVQMQTYQDMEIILVDDGSTDDSGQLCDVLATEDVRIQVIHKVNGGLSDARNAGLRLAKGEYVLFLDSDDMWLLPDGLEKIEEALQNNPTDLLLFKRVDLYATTDTLSIADCRQSIERDYDTTFIYSHTAVDVFSQLVRTQRFNMSACFQAIQRALLTDNDIYFPVGMLSEDVDWSLRLWQKVDTVQALNLNMYGYWHHSGSITTTYSIRNLRCYGQMFTIWIERLPKLNENYAKTVAGYLAGLYVSCLYQYGQIATKDRREAKQILRTHQSLLQYSMNAKANRAAKVYQYLGFCGMLCLFATYGCVKRQLKNVK